MILNSDSVNRYGYRFTIGALNQAFEGNNGYGLPTLLSHDSHRIVGWTVPDCLYLENDISLILGHSFIAETNEEKNQLNVMYGNYINFKENEVIHPYKEELKRVFTEDEVNIGKPISLECVALNSSGIVKKFFPELVEGLDKDGLVHLSALKDFKYLGAGVFQKGEIAVFAHRCFRRSLSLVNNTNHQLLNRLVELSQLPKVNLRIALDLDCLGLAATYKEQFELEYWWGPQFNDDLSAITPGVTRHAADESLKLYHGINFTDFWWQSRKNEHIFEAEEVLDKETFSEPFHNADKERHEEYGCRYVHSIVDEKSKKIIHLDGSIRFYDVESICARMDIDITKTRRDKPYLKLWRIDGDVSLKDWKSLIHDYYRDNSLIGEYFGMKRTLQSERPENESKMTAHAAKVPYSIPENSGIRVSISYGDRTSDENISDQLTSLTYFKDTKKIPIMNLISLEFIKLMKNKGVIISVPSDVSFIKYPDNYFDFPLYVSDGSKESLANAMLSLGEFCSWCIRKSLNARILFNFKYPITDLKYIVVSIYSNDEDWLSLLKSDIKLPVVWDEIEPFLEKIKSFNLLHKCRANLNTFSIVNKSGIIHLDRQQLPPDTQIDFIQSEKGIEFELTFLKGQEELFESYNKKEIFPCFAVECSEIECETCRNNYFLCNCSKSISNSEITISKSSALFSYWTDRPSGIRVGSL